MKTCHNAQRGFSLVTAVFLVVVVASLGAMMATFFAAQQQSAAIDALGPRAYQAARAGAEWGIFQAKNHGIGYCGAAPLSLPASSSFSVAVSCSASTYSEGAASTVVYDLVVAASGVDGALPGSLDYVERTVRVGVWDAGTASAVIWK